MKKKNMTFILVRKKRIEWLRDLKRLNQSLFSLTKTEI